MTKCSLCTLMDIIVCAHQIQLEYQLRESGLCAALHARLSLQFIMSSQMRRRLRLNVFCRENAHESNTKTKLAAVKLVFSTHSKMHSECSLSFCVWRFFFSSVHFLTYSFFFFIFTSSHNNGFSFFGVPKRQDHLFMSQLFIACALSLLCWLHINYINGEFMCMCCCCDAAAAATTSKCRLKHNRIHSYTAKK